MRVTPSKKMSPVKSFFLRIFPYIFIVVGAIVTYLGISGLIKAKASLDWPGTQGVVVGSSVERQVKRGSNGGQSTTYHAKILYEFSVDGTIFKGDRVAYGDFGSSDPSHAHRVVNSYPKGKGIMVYYMVKNPKECLLEPGLKMQSLFSPGLGLIFFTAGILMAVFLPRVIRKQKITESTNK